MKKRRLLKQLPKLRQQIAKLKGLVTSCKQTERVLEKDRNFISAVLDTAAALVVVLDREGRIVHFNRACERTTGYSFDEVKGKSLWDIFLIPEEVQPVRNVFDKLQAGQFPSEYQNYWVAKDGSYRLIAWSNTTLLDERSSVEHIIGTGIDITERKRSEEEYKTILRTAMDGFWITDMQGRFLEVNDAYCDLIGYTRDELLNMNIKDVEAVEKPEETAQHIRHIMESGGDRFETRHRCKSGRIVDIEVSVNYINVGGGRLVVFLRDVTERKQTSEEIRKINEDLERRTLELEAANKELEAFSYSVSHDLRTPLVAVGSLTRILMERYSSQFGDKGKEFLGAILGETEQMGHLIDDLLALSCSGRQALQLSDIDMNDLARSVVEELKLLETGRTLQLNLRPLPAAHGDQKMIRQVLTNLLSNAMKFTRPKPEAVIEIGGKAEDRETTYYIKDNGVGFDLADANKLFKVFERLHPSEEFEGTGVGLAIVWRVIQRHGGRVWAEGNKNEGATFYFSLPS